MGSLRITKSKKIYVRFSYAEKQREEPTAYYCIGKGTSDCKCRECKSARAIVMAVEREIRENTFDYSKYFPKSKALKELGYYAIDKNITFSKYADRFLKSSTLAKSTHRVYKTNLAKLNKHFGDKLLRNIVPTIIKEYIKINLSRYSPQYQNNILSLLSNIMESAKRDKIIEENPLQYIARIRVGTIKADPLFLDEVEKILEYSKKHHPKLTLFFAIGFFMGLRIGEITGLKWSDFDFEKNILRVQRTITEGFVKESTKTRDYRDIPIPDIIHSYIANHVRYDDIDWVFVTNKKEHYKHYVAMTGIWKRILKRLDIRYRVPYQMRHSFACNGLLSGFDMPYIQMMLGHSTFEKIFKVYGNFVPKHDNKNGFKAHHFS